VPDYNDMFDAQGNLLPVQPGVHGVSDIAAPNYSKLKPLSDEESIANKFMNQQRRAGLKLSPSQLKAVEDYTSGSGDYSLVNTSLRDPADFATWGSPKQKQAAQNIIQELDSIIQKAPALDADTLTYRGIYGDAVEGFLNLKPGDVITDNGFVSTSLRKKVAENFARVDTAVRNPGIVIEIINPAGTKGVFPIATRIDLEKPLPFKNSEREWLLPRNTSFEVLEVTANLIKVVIK
jgi:hypothetical protein